MAEQLVLDAGRMDEVTEGDRQLEIELASLYVSTAQRYVDQMALCLSQGQEWSAPAHALKGASANLGAVKMQELAKAAEQGSPSPEIMASLEHGLEEVRSALVERTGVLHVD